MANPWFRLYGEIINDPKVMIVTEALRWRYVALLCLQCNGTLENSPDDEVALALRITVDEWLETREILIKRRLLDSNGKLSKWEERQFISDLKDPTAADRQKRYRDRKRNDRNGSVTSRPPESDPDPDTDTKKEKPSVRTPSAPSRFAEFWEAWPRSPRKVSKATCEKKWKARRLDENADQIIAHVKAMQQTQQWRDGFDPAPLTYINQSRWVDEIVVGTSKPNGGHPQKPWFLTAPGIEAKANELGLKMGADEIFPNYRQRVYKAAGLTPEEYRKGVLDFGE